MTVAGASELFSAYLTRLYAFQAYELATFNKARKTKLLLFSSAWCNSRLEDPVGSVLFISLL